MRRIARLLFAVTTSAGALVFAAASGHNDTGPSMASMIAIPPGYRDWKLISVAHEEGKLNDLRAILGNDASITAYREKQPLFPDGAIIARIAWAHVASDQNNKVLGHQQSFIAGPPPDWYLQFMVKDSAKYAATGGWGYAQFDKDGKPAAETQLKTCFPCHQTVKARDYVFTRYAP